jgi:hypothetical protein
MTRILLLGLAVASMAALAGCFPHHHRMHLAAPHSGAAGGASQGATVGHLRWILPHVPGETRINLRRPFET